MGLGVRARARVRVRARARARARVGARVSAPVARWPRYRRDIGEI